MKLCVYIALCASSLESLLRSCFCYRLQSLHTTPYIILRAPKTLYVFAEIVTASVYISSTDVPAFRLQGFGTTLPTPTPLENSYRNAGNNNDCGINGTITLWPL